MGTGLVPYVNMGIADAARQLNMLHREASQDDGDAVLVEGGAYCDCEQMRRYECGKAAMTFGV